MDQLSQDQQPKGGIHLTSDDIERLIQSPSEKKMDITKKIARYYEAGGFKEEEMAVAEKIFCTLVQDTMVEVRRHVALQVKNLTNVPKEAVMELANDVEEVSLPILEFSEILTDIDLIEIVQSAKNSTAKLQTIAGRKDVTEQVSDALIESHNEVVVDTLLNNEAAQVSETGYQTIAEDFSESDNIMESLISREELPVSIVERLATAVSDALYEKLETKHGEAVSQIKHTKEQGSELATMKVIGLEAEEAQYHEFRDLMTRLNVDQEMIPISALCMGNLNFFEVTLARMTQVTVMNVKTLVMDNSNNGLKALYTRAKLPENLYTPTQLLIEVLRELGSRISKERRGLFVTKDMAEIIANRLKKKAEPYGELENLDYILSLIALHSNSK